MHIDIKVVKRPTDNLDLRFGSPLKEEGYFTVQLKPKRIKLRSLLVRDILN